MTEVWAEPILKQAENMTLSAGARELLTRMASGYRVEALFDGTVYLNAPEDQYRRMRSIPYAWLHELSAAQLIEGIWDVIPDAYQWFLRGAPAAFMFGEHRAKYQFAAVIEALERGE